jgi:hypothetical protein
MTVGGKNGSVSMQCFIIHDQSPRSNVFVFVSVSACVFLPACLPVSLSILQYVLPLH